MNKKATYPDAADLKLRLPDYFLWEEPDRGIRIYLSQDVVARLQLEVLRDGDSSVTEHAEVGGILLGRREVDDTQEITVVEDFVPVPCDYARGRFYCLSEDDVCSFGAAIARNQSDNGCNLAVVGYYRSHNRNDLYLSPDDLKLIHRFFAKPDKVFLLIKTLPSKTCTAGFFFWENGYIQTEFTYLEVPFGPTPLHLASEHTTRVTEMVNDTQAGAVANGSKECPPVHSRSRPRSSKAWLPSAAAALALPIALVAGFNYWRVRPSLGPTILPVEASNLGLRAHRNTASLAVTWNSNSPKILAAEEGILDIRDGTTQHILSLDQRQLRSGEASYTPLSEDMQFRLEVYREGKPISVDSLHVLMPGSAVPVAVHQTGSDTLAPQNSEAFSVSSKSDGIVIASRAASLAPSRRQDTAQFVPPANPTPQVSNGVDDLKFDQPPSLAIEAAKEAVIPLASVDLALRPPPPEPPRSPAERAAVEDKPQPAAAAAVGEGRPRPSSSGFVAAQLISRAEPAIPSEIRARIHTEIQLDVLLTVDSEGKVIDARISSTTGPAAALIAGEVLQAARLFRFRPARANNRNVQSNVALTFVVKLAK